eukprot:799845-Amphidinium_carterae.1
MSITILGNLTILFAIQPTSATHHPCSTYQNVHFKKYSAATVDILPCHLWELATLEQTEETSTNNLDAPQFEKNRSSMKGWRAGNSISDDNWTGEGDSFSKTGRPTACSDASDARLSTSPWQQLSLAEAVGSLACVEVETIARELKGCKTWHMEPGTGIAQYLK